MLITLIQVWNSLISRYKWEMNYTKVIELKFFPDVNSWGIFNHVVTKPASINTILCIFLIEKAKIIEDWL